MRSTQRAVMTSALAVSIVASGLLVNEHFFCGSGPVSTAEARVGRPLTPLSYAGVARRHTRRAVAAGAVATGAVAAGAYGAAHCTHVRNAYGHFVTRCY